MAEASTLFLPIEEATWERLRSRSPTVWEARRDTFDVRWMTFLAHVCHWWLDEQALDTIAWQAREIVASGADNPLLHEFAALIQDADEPIDEAELRPLVTKTMLQEGYPDTGAGGLELYLDIHLGRIARGVVHPCVGAAAAIWGASGASSPVPDLIFLLDGLTCSWDKLEPMMHRPQIERIIADLARDYVRPRFAAGHPYAEPGSAP